MLAHRGGRHSTPENTLAAFEHALRLRTGIELDVHLTRDGQVAVFHDSSLERMCGGWAGKVSDHNFLDLPAVHKRASEGWDQGVSNGAVAAKVRIPLLGHVLDLVAREEHAEAQVLIEFKEHSVELVQRVHLLLRERGLLSERHLRRLRWFSLSHATQSLLVQHDPRVPLLTSVADVIKLSFAYRLGLLPLVRVRATCFGATALDDASELLWYIDRLPVLRLLPGAAKRAVARWYLDLMRDPGLYFALRDEHGLETMLLDVNSESELEHALRCGAGMVITDHPEWLVPVLQGRAHELT